MANFINTLKAASANGAILAPHLDNWFARGVFPDEIPLTIHPNKKPDNYFHPSSHCTGCLREIYAKVTGILPKEDFSATQQKTFQIGHMYHALLQYILVEELGFVSWEHIEHRKEIKVTTEQGNTLHMAGSADASTIHVPGRDKPIMADIKTAAGRSFAKDCTDSPFWPSYHAQAQVYMDWHARDICVMLYQSKDTPHDFKEKVIERDHEFVDDIYDRWITVADHMAAGEPPICDCEVKRTCRTAKLEFAAA